ncbi:MAG: hypothetical protein BWY25_02248 [Chloroflexi bacterium ADurb.Bin222]|nr:MAG: hypothetical protein BWY25_02248 [Chloroflexi bacterium ADurb.Bin222]
MPGLEHLRRIFQVEIVHRGLEPWQREQPIEIGADDADFGRHRGQHRQPPQLLLRPLPHVLGQFGLLQLLAQLGDLLHEDVGFAQLALNRAHLLTEEVLPLRAIHFLLHPRLDLILQLQDVQLARQLRADLLQPLNRVEGLQNLLALLDVQIHHLRDEIRQRPRLLDIHRVDVSFLRQAVVEMHDLLEHRQHSAHQRFDQRRVRRRLLDGFDPRDQIGL